jgi:demethylmenaquinone methyltransferase / 2-methoxy-6-polyprenyl-1,4-benzoquinol methylase
MSAVNPSRDRAVQNMFDRISGRYDLLNRVISFRLDARWRHQVIRTALTTTEPRILDIGTGTGDLVFDAAKAAKGTGKFVGLDFSLQMLRLACAKREKASHGASAVFVMGSAMVVPFKKNTFDGAMSAFVLRNVSDLALLFAEAHRVLKPGGKFVSLDMFPPSASWFSPFYSIYFHCLMPRIGALLAHDRAAYRYLSDSVRQFLPPEKVAAMIEQAGFEQVTVRKFLSGAVCMHTADKPSRSREP